MRQPKESPKRFNLNIPMELWEPLQDLARANRRTVTSQIVAIINAEIMRSDIEWREREPTKSA